MAQQQQGNSGVNSAVVQLASQVAAAQQAIQAMQRQKQVMLAVEQQQHGQNDSNLLVQNVVINIDRTLHRISELHGLHLKKKRLVARYGDGALPPEGESQKRHLDKQLQQGYSQLSKNIQFANESIGCFNKSPAAHVPYLLHIVSFKRQQLNSQLQTLKSGPSRSVGGAAPPTGSSQGVSSGQYNHTTGHGGGSVGAEVTSSRPTKPTNPTVKERLIARVAGSNEEKQMRETAKELLVKKTKVPADSSTNVSAAKKN